MIIYLHLPSTMLILPRPGETRLDNTGSGAPGPRNPAASVRYARELTGYPILPQ